jgi:uncharacterized membrane protein
MGLTWVLFLFLVAAIIFGLDVVLGLVVGEVYTRFHPRVWSFCFCLWSIAALLWHGGK